MNLPANTTQHALQPMADLAMPIHRHTNPAPSAPLPHRSTPAQPVMASLPLPSQHQHPYSAHPHPHPHPPHLAPSPRPNQALDFMGGFVATPPNRIPNGAPFFNPSSSSPIPITNQSLGPAPHAGFPTPAQQFEQMNHPPDSTQFGMPPPSAHPRPISHTPLAKQQPQHQPLHQPLHQQQHQQQQHQLQHQQQQQQPPPPPHHQQQPHPHPQSQPPSQSQPQLQAQLMHHHPPQHRLPPPPPVPPSGQPPMPPHHASPHPLDNSMHPPPPRPQSQLARPSSGPGPSRTPRPAQPSIPPPGSGVANPPQPTNPQLARMPIPPGLPSSQSLSHLPHPATAGPPPSAPNQPSLSIASRPPHHPPIRAPPSMTQPPPPAENSQHNIPIQRPLLLGSGQGLIRLLQFSGILSGETKMKLQLAWWNDLIKDYFTPKAFMKLTLWKDNQRKEAKPFEIGVPILPRFFLVTTQSGVKSMSLSLDGARERIITQGHSIVECVAAIWTYRYNNGYTVTLRGALSAHVIITSTSAPGTAAQPSSYTFKFDELTFDANYHDKFIALDAIMGQRVPEPAKSPWIRNAPTPNANGTPTMDGINTGATHSEEDKKWEEPRVLIERCSIPGEPVNAFGIPQATMRCLELAESVGSMADLIVYSNEAQLGPLEALKSLAMKIREGNNLNNQDPSVTAMNGFPGAPQHPHHFGSSVMPQPSPAVTLYSAAPTNTPMGMSINSPQTLPGSAMSSPQKQHKSIPHQQGSALQQQQMQGGGGGGAQTATPTMMNMTPGAGGSPSVSSGATNTPSLANATLRKRQAEAASPSSTADQVQGKRLPRKRGRTGTGGG